MTRDEIERLKLKAKIEKWGDAKLAARIPTRAPARPDPRQISMFEMQLDIEFDALAEVGR